MKFIPLFLLCDSSLADSDWGNRTSSAVVSGGCQWILYDVAGFEDRSHNSLDSGIISSLISPSVISPGSYPFSVIPTFGLPNNVLSAVRCLPTEGTPAIVLFMHHHYFGDMQVVNTSNPNLACSQ